MAKRARKRYWIDRQIQGALAVRVAIHWLIFSSVATALTLMFQYLGSPLAPFSEHLSAIWTNQGPFALVMLLLLPVFLYDTVKLSNRFAGPVLRLRRAMTAIANDEPAERLNFRDNDFWRGLADDYNALIDRGCFDANKTEVASSEDTGEPELQEVS